MTIDTDTIRSACDAIDAARQLLVNANGLLTTQRDSARDERDTAWSDLHSLQQAILGTTIIPDVPAMLAEIARLKAEIDALKRALAAQDQSDAPDPAPVPPVVPPPVVPPAPPPVTPPVTVAADWPTQAPPDLAGITTVVQSGRAVFVHLASDATGAPVKGCQYLVVAEPGTVLDCVSSGVAGTVRRRLADEKFGMNAGFSARSGFFRTDGNNGGTVALTWPSGTFTVALPLTSHTIGRFPCFSVTAAEDRGASVQHSHASGNGIRFLVVIAHGPQAAAREIAGAPPTGRAFAPFPLYYGDDVVRPIQWTTEADSWTPIGRVLDPGDLHLDLAANLDRLASDQFHAQMGGKYDSPPYDGDTWIDYANTVGRSWSLLTVAHSALVAPSAAKDDFVRRSILYSPMRHEQVALEEHGDNTELNGGKAYDDAERIKAALVAYSWHQRLFDAVEHADIRDQFARTMWCAIWRHRNPYRKWIAADGFCTAMWEGSGWDWCARLIGDALPETTALASRARSHADIKSSSGIYGLIDRSGRWNGGRLYATNHNCIGPIAAGLAISARMGWGSPPHLEPALITLAEGTMPGAEGVRVWSPLLCSDDFPAYTAAVLAMHGRDAILAAARQTSGTVSPDDAKYNPAIPGGMGPGSQVLTALLVRV